MRRFATYSFICSLLATSPLGCSDPSGTTTGDGSDGGSETEDATESGSQTTGGTNATNGGTGTGSSSGGTSSTGSSAGDSSATEGGGTDDESSTGEQQNCEDGPDYTRQEIVDAGVETLRRYFSTDDGFEGGEVLFLEGRAGPAECGVDESSIAYRVDLPAEFRPRPFDITVAAIWDFSGHIWVFVQSDTSQEYHPYRAGQNATGMIMSMSYDASTEDVDAFVEMIDSTYPAASLEYFPATKDTNAGVLVDFGLPWSALEQPDLVLQALELHASAQESPLVDAVNLASLAFDEDVVWGEVQTIDTEQVELDCLRTFSSEGTLWSETSLFAPLGPGQELNDDCWDL